MIKALSLRLRITLFLVAAIVVTLGGATWLLDTHIDNELAKEADTNLLERAQALSDISRLLQSNSTKTVGLGRMPEFLAADGISYFTIQCQGRQTLSVPAAAALNWPTMASDAPAFGDMSDSLGTELRGVVLHFQPSAETNRASTLLPRCSLGLAVDLKAVRRFQRSMDNIGIGCIVLGMLIVVLLAPLLVRRGLQPLSRLAEAVQLIGPDAPDRRLDTDSAAELRPLITRFNEVLARMEEGLMRERQFASGVAHELRTPLAELRTMIEVELRYPSGRDPRNLLAELGTVGGEMERLVSALLLLTRIEAGIEQVHYQPVDIGALTDKLLERCHADIQKRKLEFTVEKQGPLFWEADPTLLEITLGNLVSNAVAYAPAGSRLVLGYQSCTWWLQNDASDLTPSDLEFMRRRFWRKGRDAGVHAGLGVALVAATASAQSMQLRLSLKDGAIHALITTNRAARNETLIHGAVDHRDTSEQSGAIGHASLAGRP